MQSLRHASAPSVMIAIRSVLTQACVFIYLSTKLFSATSEIFEPLFKEGIMVVEFCCPKALSREKKRERERERERKKRERKKKRFLSFLRYRYCVKKLPADQLILHQLLTVLYSYISVQITR